MLIPFLMEKKSLLKKFISPTGAVKIQRGLSTILPLEKLLLGGEYGIDADKYAELIGEPQRLSKGISHSAHVQLLKSFDLDGENVFTQCVFEKTPYYLNSIQAMLVAGKSPSESCDARIRNKARGFINRYLRVKGDPAQFALIDIGKPISARPIVSSDCYQIINGHHRCAIAQHLGIKEVPVFVGYKPVMTPLQRALGEVRWGKGKKLLYQPILAPEVEARWLQVRKCGDRLMRMLLYLDSRALGLGPCRTYLDVGSYYGWFVSEMSSRGFESLGIEIDSAAVEVGKLAYDLDSCRILHGNAFEILKEQGVIYDVVSCLSLLHHCVLRRGIEGAQEMLRLLDSRTGKVLFLDTGQAHERWFKRSLPEWNEDFIARWIRENSSFVRVERLGCDDDAVGNFRSNYGRMLFACSRE